MEYEIVEAVDSDGLTEEVNSMLKQGWKPQGGVNVLRYEYEVEGKEGKEVSYLYSQALVR
ncbi:MAG: DUF1737 domain-containing protein [Proteobacteria bacterium]|nr:DUF1737 domain-containing protein [Pseudomonadota bacterium]